MTRGYRTEINFKNKQLTRCKKQAGAARWAWNWASARKHEMYQQTGRSLSAMELPRKLNTLKQTPYPARALRDFQVRAAGSVAPA